LPKTPDAPIFTEFDKRIAAVTKDQEQTQLAAVGARIRSVRETSGLSLHELALLCGISAPALSLIETGKRDLRITSLYRIASALRVPVGGLLEDENKKPPENEAGTRRGYDLGDYT
jgi:HTH-type transcriptional regulator, competence development regulator